MTGEARLQCKILFKAETMSSFKSLLQVVNNDYNI